MTEYNSKKYHSTINVKNFFNKLPSYLFCLNSYFLSNDSTYECVYILTTLFF